MTILSFNSLFSQFTVDGEFRTRAELRNGYKELASESNYLNLLSGQRSRLIMNFKDTGYSFRFTMQDARVWGQNGNMGTNAIYEAWAEISPSSNFSFRLGRQALSYDDQKILSSRNFSNSGASYDAALLIYNNKKAATSVHWGSMINNSNDANFLNYYSDNFKYMWFIWGEKKFSDKVKISVLNLFDLTQNPMDSHIMYGRNTIGANGVFNLSSSIGGRMGGYYQFGDGYMGFANYLEAQKWKLASYSFNATIWAKPIERLKLSMNVDTYSGHNWSEKSETFGGFNRLLAGGHSNLGFMDYFTTMDLREVKWAGINNWYFRADLSLNPKVSLQGTAHSFHLNKSYFPIVNNNNFEKVKSYLGTEIDLVANYKHSSMLSMEATFMTILPGETLKKVKLNGNNSEFSFFSYISLLFTPNFFKYN